MYYIQVPRPQSEKNQLGTSKTFEQNMLSHWEELSAHSHFYFPTNS